MDLKDRHIWERNKLAFKFGSIIQFFELVATVVYAAERVGFVNTAFMVTCQVIIAGFFVFSYLRYSHRNRGKYLMMTALLGSYFVVMLGSVHITYMWAFGPGILVLVLLFADNILTQVTAIIVVLINVLYTPLFFKYSVEVADRKNAVLTDIIFALLIGLMAIFYVRLNSRHNKESVEEIEEAARLQQESAKARSEEHTSELQSR